MNAAANTGHLSALGQLHLDSTRRHRQRLVSKQWNTKINKRSPVDWGEMRGGWTSSWTHTHTSQWACVFRYSAFMKRLFAQPLVCNYVFTIKFRITGQTNSSSIDERRHGICPLHSEGERESKVNLSKGLLCGVQTESALHNGLINGTMSRTGRAIIADDFSLWGYLWRSALALRQMIWPLGVISPKIWADWSDVCTCGGGKRKLWFVVSWMACSQRRECGCYVWLCLFS